MMESHPLDAATKSERHKCPACFKQYKKKQHLVEHMQISYHSVHQPKCSICNKHCKSLESVREHLIGPLAKRSCSEIFRNQGCNLCLKIFSSFSDLATHKALCHLNNTVPLVKLLKDLKGLCLVEKTTIETKDLCPTRELTASGQQTVSLDSNSKRKTNELALSSDGSPGVVAMDCEMVGGGSDGSLDLCARICLTDENEHIIFHSFIKPQLPITDYRFEMTGLSEESLADASSLESVRRKVEEILYNKESISTARLSGGRARILVGHEIEKDLDCLGLSYPDHLIRDTAHYPPLMKTNFVSHSLKYLTKTYLGYDIQDGVHDPYEDSVAALRLYKRLRSQSHQLLESGLHASESYNKNAFSFFEMSVLEKKSPDELLQISCSKYRCWCLDQRQTVEPSLLS